MLSSCNFTLFPYTTLFRSKTLLMRRSLQVSAEFNVPNVVLSLAGFQVTIIGRFWVTAESFYGCLFGRKIYVFSCYVLQSDRKSTRLNSSHVAISYAVFCLK